jgi:hypothetical protein
VKSSPAAANGVVYVGSADNNMHALSAATGARLWSYATGSVVLGSPAVANGVIHMDVFGVGLLEEAVTQAPKFAHTQLITAMPWPSGRWGGRRPAPGSVVEGAGVGQREQDQALVAGGGRVRPDPVHHSDAHAAHRAQRACVRFWARIGSTRRPR